MSEQNFFDLDFGQYNTQSDTDTEAQTNAEKVDGFPAANVEPEPEQEGNFEADSFDEDIPDAAETSSELVEEQTVAVVDHMESSEPILVPENEIHRSPQLVKTRTSRFLDLDLHKIILLLTLRKQQILPHSLSRVKYLELELDRNRFPMWWGYKSLCQHPQQISQGIRFPDLSHRTSLARVGFNSRPPQQTQAVAGANMYPRFRPDHHARVAHFNNALSRSGQNSSMLRRRCVQMLPDTRRH